MWITFRSGRVWCAALVCLASCASTPTPTPTPAPTTLPAASTARRGAHVDTYHGEQVADPYRWMEEIDTPEVQEWITAQNARTEAFLSAVPARQAIADRITKLWDFEKFGLPERHGPWVLYQRNSGLREIQHRVLTLSAGVGVTQFAMAFVFAPPISPIFPIVCTALQLAALCVVRAASFQILSR